MEQTAKDYADILSAVDVEKKLEPISKVTDDLLSRLDELEALLTTVKTETNGILEQHVKPILEFNKEFITLQQRIDQLDAFTEMISNNLTALEQSVDVAEDELNVTDYSIRGLLLKPLLAKAKSIDGDGATANAVRSNLKDGEFQPITIFNTNDYFTPIAEKSNDQAAAITATTTPMDS